MNIVGVVKQIFDSQKISDKFTKREFVITDNSSQYAQHIIFQLANDKCDYISKYSVGDEINVHFNLRGREWTNPQGEVKYFNTLDCWKIDGKTNANSNQGQPQYTATTNSPQQPHQDMMNPASFPSGPQDDLPF